jgi:hypothetical protein
LPVKYFPNPNPKHMKQKVVCIFPLLVFFACCMAQQVVSSGGHAVSSEISVNWILGGDVSAISDYHPGNADLKNEEPVESGISLNVYPSPAIDFINIEITPADTGRFILDLYNDSGKKVLAREVANQPLIQINICEIPCGVYFLKVFLADSHELIKVEKIVKTQTNPL